jgi:ElaB/YqjD/DUF883 family membrane-anchored ribosome-binding protein
MAPNDADMPASRPLSDELKQLAGDLAALRADLKGLTGDVKTLGADQAENLQATAEAALDDFGRTVKRNPLSSIAVALGAGFLYGVLTRR